MQREEGRVGGGGSTGHDGKAAFLGMKWYGEAFKGGQQVSKNEGAYILAQCLYR